LPAHLASAEQDEVATLAAAAVTAMAAETVARHDL
jgi:hypothetical protein